MNGDIAVVSDGLSRARVAIASRNEILCSWRILA